MSYIKEGICYWKEKSGDLKTSHHRKGRKFEGLFYIPGKLNEYLFKIGFWDYLNEKLGTILSRYEDDDFTYEELGEFPEVIRQFIDDITQRKIRIPKNFLKLRNSKEKMNNIFIVLTSFAEFLKEAYLKKKNITIDI